MSRLPRGWVAATLGQIATKIGSGATPTGGERSYKASGIPLIRSLNVHFGGVRAEGLAFLDETQAAKLNNVIVEADDVLLNITGASIGRVAVAPVEYQGARVNQHVSIIRLVQDVLSNYVCSFLASPTAQNFITRENYGATRQALTKSMIEDFAFPLAPLAEQKRIVAKLDALNAKSARARTELARIETLVSHYKQAVLSKAFSGEFGRKELSELVVRIKAGKNLRCEERPPHPDEKGVVKVSAVTWGEFRPDQSKTFPSDFEPEEDTRIKSGDFLFSRANTIDLVGAVVIVGDTPDNLYLSDKILRFEFREPVETWLLWYLRSPMGREALMNISSGNQLSMRNIGQKNLLSLSIPYADFELRDEIVRRIESAFAKIDRLAKEAKRALELVGRLDEAILAKAFRGELVPQDENDEPADRLLARIRAERETAPRAKGRRGEKR
jgi:type I restriction enzyme S subunit